MNVISIIIGIASFILLIVGMIPLLGWLNWLVAIACITGIIFGACSDKKSGFYINVAVLCVGGLRLILGGGLL